MNLSQTDEPFFTLRWRDPLSDATGYLAYHAQVRGLSAGGCRVRPGLSSGEIARLAQTMTHKFALFEVPIGGAKCGLDYDPAAPDMPQVLARFFTAIRPLLRESFMTGEDLGTHEDLIIQTLKQVGLDTIYDAAINTWGTSPDILLGIPQVLTADVDGMPLGSMLAGYGVSQAALEALERLGPAPDQARASIQGFGTVGGAAAKVLSEAGVRVVAISDAEGTVLDAQGLDIAHLLAHRSAAGIIDRAALPDSVLQMGRDAWLEAECELLVPAAISDAVDLEGARSVSDSVRVVAQGANLPLSLAAEQYLHEMGVFVIPDFLANSAFAMASGALILGWVGLEAHAIVRLVADRLRSATQTVLDGYQKGEFPRDAAVRVAELNLKTFQDES